MRGISEVHGYDLIKRVANEKLNEKNNKSRVWSEEMQSWGFFSKNPNENDVFLIIGCCSPGDMFIPTMENPHLFLFSVPDCNFVESVNQNNPHIILKLTEFFSNGSHVYGLEMLGSNPPKVVQLLAYHKTLFKIAWESL
jgi:hypothetical protein